MLFRTVPGEHWLL